MVITNGFTYLAVLMFIAGGLLALQKYAKWKVFNVVPPLVWIYVLNMIFCTAGLYSSDACSAAYSALKNNILYAMIFVMLLRCDFRKLAKLSGRMIAKCLKNRCKNPYYLIFLLSSVLDLSSAIRFSKDSSVQIPGVLPQRSMLPG